MRLSTHASGTCWQGFAPNGLPGQPGGFIIDLIWRVSLHVCRSLIFTCNLNQCRTGFLITQNKPIHLLKGVQLWPHLVFSRKSLVEKQFTITTLWILIIVIHCTTIKAAFINVTYVGQQPWGTDCWRLRWVWVISALRNSRSIAKGRQSFSAAAAF